MDVEDLPSHRLEPRELFFQRLVVRNENVPYQLREGHVAPVRFQTRRRDLLADLFDHGLGIEAPARAGRRERDLSAAAVVDAIPREDPRRHWMLGRDAADLRIGLNVHLLFSFTNFCDFPFGSHGASARFKPERTFSGSGPPEALADRCTPGIPTSA